ncbi:MAG: CoA transferase [Acidimicrobiales bacterium]
MESSSAPAPAPGLGILSAFRVVDLSTGIAGGYASKLLADAGAEVVKIESAGGDPLRRWRIGGDVPAGEDGALFRFLHTNKRGVVGDLADDFVCELMLDADLVIESFEPGVIESLDLSTIAPALVVLSISPWGRGPWQHRPATEFTLQAECGSLGRRGNPERPPVQCGGRLGEWITGTAAALGGLAAMVAARRTGHGEHVDVAAFDTMMLTMNGYAHLLGSFTGTTDSGLARSVEIPSIEPTIDGYVGFCTVAAQQFQDFLVLIDAGDWLADPTYANRDTRWRHREEFTARVHTYTSAHTTEDVMQEAAAFRIPVAPIGNGATVTDLEACRGRESFVRNPNGGFLQPNIPYRVHGTSVAPLQPAPALGDSTDRIALRSRPRAGVPAGAPRPAPLDGVRVVDLTAWWAGPFASHQLGVLGADIVKVESIQRPDGMRFSSAKGPADAARWWEWSSIFHAVNTNKRAITADLRRPEGVEIVRRLIERADVVIENFTPRVLENFGLGWDVIHAINPRVILTRMPAFGLTGEWRDRPGFAQTMEQASGMAYITGYPDEAMQIPRGPCDPLAGLHAAFATLVALEERERSGIGRLVEVTMFEAALNAAAEQIVEYSAYGNTLERAGNRSPAAAPQGVYRCAGDEQWLALSVETDAHWSALQPLLDNSMLSEPRFYRREGRQAGHDTIDRVIDEWTATRTVQACVDALVAAGVPAAKVAVDRSLGTHRSLGDRGYFEAVEHSVTGTQALPTAPFRFARRDQRWLSRPAPVLGEHNVEVLHELGYADDEITALRVAKVIGDLPANL